MFLRDTLSWISESPAQKIKSGTAEYFIAPPQGGVVEMVKDVWLSGKALVLAPIADYPHGNNRTGTPAYAYIKPNDRLLLLPTPNYDAAGALIVVAAYNIKPDSDKVPDVVSTGSAGRYAVESEAIARLKMKPGTPWYDPSGGQYHHGVYLEERTNAIAYRNTGRMMGGQTIKRRRFM